MLIQRWQTDFVSTLKYGYYFNVTIKILIFQASLYKNKIAFRVNPKSALFQRWILSMNQRWQIHIESTWVSGWPTSQRYFSIYQRWINVESLLGYRYITFNREKGRMQTICGFRSPLLHNYDNDFSDFTILCRHNKGFRLLFK